MLAALQRLFDINTKKESLDLPETDSSRERAQAIMEGYRLAIQTRKQYLAALQDVETSYLAEIIIDGMIDDALTPDITTAEVVELSSPNEKINDILVRLQQEIDIDALCLSVAPELLRRGEHTVRIATDDGFEIVDDVDQDTIAAAYRKDYPKKFIVQQGGTLHLKSARNYVHFCYGKSKIRLKVVDLFGNATATNDSNFPDYVRVGKPLFYKCVQKLRDLELMEALLPATKVAALSRSSITSVSVPQQTSVKEAFQIAREYERILNVQKKADLNNVDDIISAATKTKVLPTLGEKGTLEKVDDVRKNDSSEDLLSSIEDLRKIICSSAGYPYELIFASDSGEKVEILKRYSRYFRKLKALQHAIAFGLKQLAISRVLHEGVSSSDFSSRDIVVIFKNEFINIDELEKLEFSDATIATMGSVLEFLERLRENDLTKDMVDPATIHSWLYHNIQLIQPGTNFIKTPDSDKKVPSVKQRTQT